MHASSFENMARCAAQYIAPAMAARDRVLVVDVGGADVNGGYRPLFDEERHDYRTVDLEAGDGVDIVLDDPYVLPFEDHSVDVMLSGQMLEHCEFFWQTFVEMMRVLKKDGILVLIAPSGGPIHRYPVDCYRFYPDAFHALAKYAGCRLLHLHHDERGPWKDLVGVFAWQEVDGTPAPAPVLMPESTYDVTSAPLGTDEEEVVRGEGNYFDTLRRLHHVLEPRLYLEIGVRHGRSLALATGRAVGVDPRPELEVELPETTTVVSEPSDRFFEAMAGDTLDAPVDLAFIDGMHLFEYALRDFMNVERRAHPGAAVVIDDVFPGHPAQAERDRRTRAWTGDVWKLHAVLRETRPDLTILALDTSPTGMLLVTGLNPANRVLWERYNPLMRQWVPDLQVPEEVVAREQAMSPDAPEVEAVLDVLVRSREEGLAPGALQSRLRRAVQRGAR